MHVRTAPCIPHQSPEITASQIGSYICRTGGRGKRLGVRCAGRSRSQSTCWNGAFRQLGARPTVTVMLALCDNIRVSIYVCVCVYLWASKPAKRTQECQQRSSSRAATATRRKQAKRPPQMAICRRRRRLQGPRESSMKTVYMCAAGRRTPGAFQHPWPLSSLHACRRSTA